MNYKQTVSLVKKIILENDPPRQIITILVFGSFAQGNIDVHSDLDILIIHSSRTRQEYTNVLNFAHTLCINTEKCLGRLVDIFFINSHLLSFTLEHLHIYLLESFQNSIIVYGKNIECSGSIRELDDKKD